MKLKFKVQPYQTAAVDAVVDCFEGQPVSDPLRYRMGPDVQSTTRLELDAGFRNEALLLDDTALLANIQSVQKRQNLPRSNTLADFTTLDAKGLRKRVHSGYQPGARVNLDVEMETGTGKTYCYIKTMFEMFQRYGWSKFIVMTPSIAIREGVQKSFQITAEHFAESYGKKARVFTYNSRRLHELESFSSDAGINVMIINIQAFNARGADNRRIYEALDDFQSRRPIDVISANRPIIILDEPQKMEGKATLTALPKFNPLMILRYSATHRTQHNRVHRLDALDAYNQKLVKKIAVRGIQTRGLTGTNTYLYLEGIEVSSHAPVARIEMEGKTKSGEIKRRLKRLAFGDDLYTASGELEQYRGYTLSQIDARQDVVEFTNGERLFAGEARGDVNESDIRRIQIRETIKAHLDKEKQLFAQGVKVLSLFFIDEVKKYRDYDQDDEKGDYARIFEREYAALREDYISGLTIDDEEYRAYLTGIDPAQTHNGYFSIDKKNRMVNPKIKKTGEQRGVSDDESAYDLILKDKERLLSFTEPTRFIFSHSALREGWDNPNVFVMCMLKHSDNTISRRQEVGRGLRLCVDRQGERLDHPSLVHEINVLTVVANESYTDFAKGLQTEIIGALSARPRKADESYFTGKIIYTVEGQAHEVTALEAKQIYRYLIKHDFIDNFDTVTDTYHQARKAGKLPVFTEELEPYRNQIIDLIDSVFDDSKLPDIDDGRKPKTNPLNDNFRKKEFQKLWSRINRKAVYRVEFDSEELITKAVNALDNMLHVTTLQYTVQRGEQAGTLTYEQLESSDSFEIMKTSTEEGGLVNSGVAYDLIGNVAKNTHLTRHTVAHILTGIAPETFDQFKCNPEHFITEASRLIQEQKATMVIESLQYDTIEDRYETDIFTAAQTGQDFSRATDRLKKHIYNYCIVDSGQEQRFVGELDTSDEITVYAKLPRGFLIPTPVGDYNPDWAISFTRGAVKHIYFMAETKGSMSSMQLREIEHSKIKCARKFFDEINRKIETNKVKYDVVTDFGKLMDMVSGMAA